MASIKQQPNGKWRYRLRYKENGKFKEISKSGFRTKKDAQFSASEIERQYRNGVTINSKNILMSSYLDEWMNVYKKPNVKQSTYLRIERAVRLHIKPTFGAMKLSEISRMDVVKWVNKLSETQKNGTVRSNLTVLYDALNIAVYELNYLEKNVATKVKIPKEQINEELKFYTKKQVEKLLSFLSTYKMSKYSHSIQYYVLFTLLTRTGLRLGEALALEWTDISGDKLTISKNLSYDDHNNSTITTPKSKSSLRTIKIDNFTKKILKKHKINKSECMLMYMNYKAPINPTIIFSNENGNYLRHSVVRDFFYVSCRRADVPILSPHALRHSHAVHLLESGVNIKYVSTRLGHSSISITADTYLHITNKIEEDALDLYQKYM